MKKEKLWEDIPVRGTIPEGDIREIYSDSRRVTPGSLFVCIRGSRADGHDFAADALKRGAAAVLAERMPREIDADRVILTDDTRRAESLLWHNLTGRAADGMRKIAVTGTAGKTTTAYLTASIFRACGAKVGFVTTVRAEADGAEIDLGENGGSSVCDIPGAMTTPDPEYFFGAVRRMRDAGCDTLVYEASSQSLMLRKTSAIIPDAAIFTNLSPEHLDAHGTMEAYFRAKASLMHGVKRRWSISTTGGWRGSRRCSRTRNTSAARRRAILRRRCGRRRSGNAARMGSHISGSLPGRRSGCAVPSSDGIR